MCHSDCDIDSLHTLAKANHLPFCDSELAHCTEFVSGLVQDLRPGVISADDFFALWEEYARHNIPQGKYRQR